MRRSLVGVFVAFLSITGVLVGCGSKDGGPASPPGGQEETKFRLTESQRIDIFHEVEKAILRNERLGREEHPEGGPECLEYIACLDDDSKAEIASAHGLTVPELEDVIREGEHSGWSQW